MSNLCSLSRRNGQQRSLSEALKKSRRIVRNYFRKSLNPVDDPTKLITKIQAIQSSTPKQNEIDKSEEIKSHEIKYIPSSCMSISQLPHCSNHIT